MPVTIQVRAKWPGYYEGHRATGAVFDYRADKEPKSLKDIPRWMKPVDWEPSEVAESEGEVDKVEALKGALAKLRKEDDAHWTKKSPKTPAGLPDLKVLTEYTGFKVSREMVNAVAPGFTRETAQGPAEGGDS